MESLAVLIRSAYSLVIMPLIFCGHKFIITKKYYIFNIKYQILGANIRQPCVYVWDVRYVIVKNTAEFLAIAANGFVLEPLSIFSSKIKTIN